MTSSLYTEAVRTLRDDRKRAARRRALANRLAEMSGDGDNTIGDALAWPHVRGRMSVEDASWISGDVAEILGNAPAGAVRITGGVERGDVWSLPAAPVRWGLTEVRAAEGDPAPLCGTWMAPDYVRDAARRAEAIVRLRGAG